MIADSRNSETLARSSLHRRLLWIHLTIAGLALFSNGAALMLVLSGKAPEITGKVTLIIAILALALVIVITGVLALKNDAYRVRALRFHAIVFAVTAIGDLLWGFNLVVKGSHHLAAEGMRITWSVGWLAAFSAYATYLITETFFATKCESSLAVKYSYVWVGVIALLFDIFVFAQLAGSMT